MRILETIRIAFDSLIRQKTRAILTMLGIIIGVGAVIAMVAVGQGAQSAVESQIASLGTNILMVIPGATSQGGVSAGAGMAVTLKDEDVDAIRADACRESLVGKPRNIRPRVGQGAQPLCHGIRSRVGVGAGILGDVAGWLASSRRRLCAR